MTGTLTGDNGAISTGWNGGADWSMYKYLVAVIESYSSTSDEPYLQILAKLASLLQFFGLLSCSSTVVL